MVQICTSEYVTLHFSFRVFTTKKGDIIYKIVSDYKFYEGMAPFKATSYSNKIFYTISEDGENPKYGKIVIHTDEKKITLERIYLKDCKIIGDHIDKVIETHFIPQNYI